jgi:ligand-binding sensor domain-containing protein
VRAGAREIVATDGNGVFLDGRRLTPAGQLCGNHVQALAEFRGRLWVGTFDSGICVLEDGKFRAVRAPFRMVNDLRATPDGLWIASAEGLFVTRDGKKFRREARLRERAVNRIAVARRFLYATTPFALYAIRLEGEPVLRRWPRPAGSTALQAVAVSGGNVWLASEDSGAIRLRRGRFLAFDRASGLPSSWAVDVAPAAGGGAWVATLRDGALRLGADGQVIERLAQGSWGLRIESDGARVLFGTQQGIAGLPLPLPDPRVHAFLRTGDALWIGTEGGLFRVEAGRSGSDKSLISRE